MQFDCQQLDSALHKKGGKSVRAKAQGKGRSKAAQQPQQYENMLTPRNEMAKDEEEEDELVGG